MAFSCHAGVFDEVGVSLIAAGEASGKMPRMLDHACASTINFQIQIRDKAISTLIYPSLRALRVHDRDHLSRGLHPADVHEE